MKSLLSKIIFISIAAIIAGAVWFYQQRITVSIIVPVYNAAEFLPRCLESILAQKGNFEVIAVNDGSTDQSLSILEAYAQKNPNLKIITQKNQGVSAARNAGIKAAKNKYVTFVDSDDWLEAGSLKDIMPLLKKDRPDILLTGFYDVYDRKWVLETGGEAAAAEAPEEAKFPTRKLDKLALFSPFYGKEAYSDLFYAGTGVRGQFFRKSFINKNMLSFPLGITCGEDDIFMYRAFLHNPLISVTTAPIYNYRNRADSLAKSENIIKDNRVSLAVLQQTPEYLGAGRRIQMLLNDSWLSWTILGMSNLLRHGQSWGAGFDEAYAAYSAFSVYNPKELEACRNLYQLRKLLFGDNPNRPL